MKMGVMAGEEGQLLSVVCDVSLVWRILLLPQQVLWLFLTLFVSICNFKNDCFSPRWPDGHDVEFILDIKLTTAPFITLMIKDMFFFTVWFLKMHKFECETLVLYFLYFFI